MFIDNLDKYKEMMVKKIEDLKMQLDDIDDNAEESEEDDSEIDDSELNDEFDVDGDFKREIGSSDKSKPEDGSKTPKTPVAKKTEVTVQLKDSKDEESPSPMPRNTAPVERQSSGYQASSKSSIEEGADLKKKRIRRSNTKQSVSDLESCNQSKTSKSLTMGRGNKKANAMMLQQETLLNNV